MFLGLPWLVWGIICLAIAAVYTVIWPRPKTPAQAQSRPLWRQLVLRWFHMLVWVLLAVSCFARLWPATTPLAGPVALAGLFVYLIFIGTVVIERMAQRK